MDLKIIVDAIVCETKAMRRYFHPFYGQDKKLGVCVLAKIKTHIHTHTHLPMVLEFHHRNNVVWEAKRCPGNVLTLSVMSGPRGADTVDVLATLPPLLGD